jgi:hypothetical protein
MVGVAGCKEIDKEKPWWYSRFKLVKGLLSGQIYNDDWKVMARGLKIFGEYGDVKILDGVCLITTKEILTKVGIPKVDWCPWDFYDHVLSMEYTKKGYKLKTIPIILCHGSAGGGQKEFDEAEKRFRKEYL